MISVIIPCHNYGKYISGCLKSIRNQTRKADEIIVVDDKSDDETPKLVKKFRTVKYFRVEFGQANKTRNFGFKKSKGKYVMFFDADDSMRKDCIEKLFKALQKDKKAGFAYSDRMDLMMKDEKIIRRERFRAKPWDLEKLKEGNYISMPAMIRRKYFKGFDEKLNRLQDWDLWLTIGKRAPGIWVSQTLFYSHRHLGGITTSANLVEADRYVRKKHKLAPMPSIKYLRIILGAIKQAILGE